MDKVTNKKQALLDNTVIDNLVDRQLIDLLHELPDPDVILRKANIDQEVYKEIMADPHVIGEVRSIRAGLLTFKHEIKAGDDSAAAKKALELCEAMFKKRPDEAMRWPDLSWSIGKAPLVGRRVHHVQWVKEGPYVVPSYIFDISTRSYCFNLDGELLIRTITSPQGEVADEYRWLVTRHMPERENPYGVALLSTCFWPWMFKNGGLKFFVKFCEKFGIPWPVGKYPQGTGDKEIQELVDRLQNMVEDAVAAIPEGVELDLLETKTSGDLPQERLVNLCNREMSKALTSQSLATEIIDGGSRAAADTHAERSQKNEKSDRSLVADTYCQLFAWITEINFGPNVPPPIWVYVDKKELNTSDVSFFTAAAKLIPIKREDIYKRLELSEPTDLDEVVFLGGTNKEEDKTDFAAQFAKSNTEFGAEDQAIADIVEQVKAAIDKGETLDQALDNILQLIPELDKDALNDLISNELELSFGQGMLEG